MDVRQEYSKADREPGLIGGVGEFREAGKLEGGWDADTAGYEFGVAVVVDKSLH
jgi:hypothetical protein